MDSLCPLVESSTETALDSLTLGSILRAFPTRFVASAQAGQAQTPGALALAACGTPGLGANLFDCPHCRHRHWAPRSYATGIVRDAWPPKLAMAKKPDTESLTDHLLPLRLHSTSRT